VTTIRAKTTALIRGLSASSAGAKTREAALLNRPRPRLRRHLTTADERLAPPRERPHHFLRQVFRGGTSGSEELM
jgi:hypothetical protein